MRNWDDWMQTQHRKLPCKGKFCWTTDQCFREILNASFTVKEVVLFDQTFKAGMVDD